jgi:hypothetical protein
MDRTTFLCHLAQNKNRSMLRFKSAVSDQAKKILVYVNIRGLKRDVVYLG